MPETVRVDEGGRIHVPKEIVEKMGLKSGGTAIIGMEGKNVVIIPARVVPVGGA
ncbi:MAG: AbrB/MazE/SpoVT family DNA-binding domain-containing protein [Euryarchaeota archaeon]|nr:AbrB/MazE/SpoVT family DNA-binding domain-containing protein [Euryarchaeota archaeon]MDE1881834.1 AbrB/MazE/SpoVT family DNA-binding domain-containing protein [Euryarchaeota archaeon]